jgi:MFS family permease
MTPTPHIHRWRAFALLAIAYFMTIIDLTIVNVSLPTIGRDLHFSETSLQWVVTAYALTFGGFLLLGGRAADLLGRRRMLMLGLFVFTAASLGCAVATGDAVLIATRAVQGTGAAIMLPAALSIVMNMFDEGAERNKGNPVPAALTGGFQRALWLPTTSARAWGSRRSSGGRGTRLYAVLLVGQHVGGHRHPVGEVVHGRNLRHIPCLLEAEAGVEQ